MADRIDTLALPEPAPSRLALRVTPAAVRTLRAGHPWVFADGIRDQSDDGNPGDLAVAFDTDRKFLAIGLYDPDGAIRFRALHHGAPAPIDEAFFRAKVGAAIDRRAELRVLHTGYRLIHGEDDGFPGFVVDRYDDVLVAKLYTAAWVPHLRTLIALIRERQPHRAFVIRLNESVRERPERLYGIADGSTVCGPDVAGPCRFTENGLRFEADVVRGQKTGFFFDQRDNRARVGALSAGRDVLNVCSYTGGFSLYAARGGARRVVSVDLSRPASEQARINFELNQGVPAVAAAHHEIIVGDAFETMSRLARQKTTFGVVVLDPPSFARKSADVPGALRAYARLVRSGLAVLEPGGRLVAASCSSRVSAEQFFEVVRATARDVHRTLDGVETTRHAVDHPTTFAEGAYLKCLFAVAR